MAKIIAAIWCFVLMGFNARSQQVVKMDIEVTFQKTSNIIFPSAIRSVDRGSGFILVQKALGVDSVLQLKARKRDFEETNLTVITSDGTLYSFDIRYAETPKDLNIVLGRAGGIDKKEDNSYLTGNCENIINAGKTINGLKEKNSGVSFEVIGIYILDSHLYFKYRIKNTTTIRYDIDQLRFYIRDQKKAKRTAIQEIEQFPVHIQNPIDEVGGNSEHIMVWVVPKFTIPDKKYLTIEMREKNGGRHIEMDIKNKVLLKAKSL